MLLRLADHKDLEASSKAYSVMARLCDEQRIWRELCIFHFTKQQINFVLEPNDSKAAPDWQRVYHKLRKYVLNLNMKPGKLLQELELPSL